MISSSTQKPPLAARSWNAHDDCFDFAAFAVEFGGTTTVRMRAETIVYRQGEPADTLFYLQQGRIRINVVSPHGREAIMAILAEDTVFGETCLLDERTRVATATCATDCLLVRVEKSNAARALRSSSGFAEFVLTRSLRRIGRLRGRLISQLFDSSEKRLARVLLALANFEKLGGDETTIENFDQEELAQMVGTTRARVSHFMNKFRRLGYIDYNGVIAVNRSLSKML